MARLKPCHGSGFLSVSGSARLTEGMAKPSAQNITKGLRIEFIESLGRSKSAIKAFRKVTLRGGCHFNESLRLEQPNLVQPAQQVTNCNNLDHLQSAICHYSALCAKPPTEILPPHFRNKTFINLSSKLHICHQKWRHKRESQDLFLEKVDASGFSLPLVKLRRE